MKARAIILCLLILCSMGWFIAQPSRYQQFEQGFFDFLVANAVDVFKKDAPSESQEVVLLEFREEDKAEYGGWPPTPLDYIMILKRLGEFEPAVISIVEPLRWDAAQSEFVAPLRTALLPFSSVVVGFRAGTDSGEMTKEQGDFMASEMPVLPFPEGRDQEAPQFARVTALSDYSLRVAVQAGFSGVEGLHLPEDTVPLVARHGSRVVPSLAAQAVILYRHMPYAEQRLRFGTGARLSLGSDFVIPLNSDGSYSLAPTPKVPAVNALELTVPDLGDDASREVRARLGKGKIIVLGNGPDSMTHARTIASLLAIPKVLRVPQYADGAFAAAAFLLAFWQLRFGRVKALMVGLGLMGCGMMVVMLPFQSALAWWSPLVGLLILALSTVFCFVWPAGSPRPSPTTSTDH